MLAAVSAYNNPLITFKTETCITMVITAWVYMLQAYCMDQGIEIRVRDTKTRQIRYRKTKEDGSYYTLPLPDLVVACSAILDSGMSNNLLFLNGIRRSIQHSVDNSIDGFVAPKIQANVLNFDKMIKWLSDGKIDIASRLPLTLQFSELSLSQASKMMASNQLSQELRTFILEFEHKLTDAERNDTAYEAHVQFELVNKNRGEDLLKLAVLKPGDDEPENVAAFALKEVEKPKYLPGEIVRMMKDEGFDDFTMQKHTDLWHAVEGSKDESRGFGVEVSGKWHWYKKWIDEQVRPYCQRGYVVL